MSSSALLLPSFTQQGPPGQEGEKSTRGSGHSTPLVRRTLVIRIPRYVGKALLPNPSSAELVLASAYYERDWVTNLLVTGFIKDSHCAAAADA